MLKAGHPKGLYYLFFTEMWERFSYYGMRALLVLYMTQHLLLDPERARSVLGYNALESILISMFGQMSVQAMSSQIYGFYTGFVYFTPFFGGIIADRWLGRHKSVYLGGLLMAIGHFLMAMESTFLIALFFLILGNGCFKPNISTQVGELYPEGDPRRDGAFTIFYMGINLGAFFSPLVCGTLGQKMGWHYGFAAAGVGMLVGLVIYHLGSHHLPRSLPSSHAKSTKKTHSGGVTTDEWKAMGALALLCFLNIVFWAIYEQQGNTLQLWADEKTNWNFFGWEVPSTWYQSFNPAMIFIFAPILSAMWAWQAKRKKEPTSVSKMGIGSILCGAAYIVMIAAAYFFVEGQKQSLIWLTFTTWMFTMGELYLSPIGLSLVTKVAPARFASMMMGVWFLSSFFGNYLSGYVGSFYEILSKDTFFGLLAASGILTGFIFFAVHKPLSKVLGKNI